MILQPKSARYLPKEAQYDYLLNLPDDITAAGLANKNGHTMTSLGEVVNNAMQLIEDQSEQLAGVFPKSYTDFSDEILSELLRIFNNSALDEVDGDIIGRIYEYFLNKFAKNIASDDGVFFTPKSLPCSLWFLDKGKFEGTKDKVLFIDARNYYTVVDRTLNEWSDWQLKNINAM